LVRFVLSCYINIKKRGSDSSGPLLNKPIPGSL
jgi:hypothetical protein